MTDFPDYPNDPEELSGEDYLGRFDLDEDGLYSVDIFRNTDLQGFEDVHYDFSALFSHIDFNTHSQDNLLDVLTVQLFDQNDEARIDIGGEDVRGGYDRDEVLEFLNHTGFWGLGTVYYDDEFDEYFVDLEDVSG